MGKTGTIIACQVSFRTNKGIVLREAEEAIERGLIAIGMEAVTMTHRDKSAGGTPVDTGRLRNSISWAVDDKAGGGSDAANARLPAPPRTLVLGSNVEYAPYIELGTYKIKPGYHMMRNALVDGQRRWEELMRASLEAADVPGGGGVTME